jgi:hypothetical protein
MPDARDGDDTGFDIGSVLGAPFTDRDWLSKCLGVGLMSFVPIVGILHSIGWSRAITVRRIDGDDQLPGAGVEHIGAGLRTLLSFLPAVLVGCAVPTALGVLIGTLLDLAGGDGDGAWIFGMMGAWFGAAVVGLGSLFLKPAADYLNIVEGEAAAGLALRQQIDLIRAGGVGNYAAFALVAFLTTLAAPIGFFLFFVGGVISVPLTEAWRGAAIAEFERIVRARAKDNAVDSTVGAASGSPFGVSI